jgi:uncharacterized membrane protein HdeD (DUF308 family)
MLASLTSKWWLFLTQGIVMIVLAALAFTQPWTVIGFIGAYAIIDGILKVIAAVVRPPEDERSRWPVLVIGAVSIVAGLVIWFNPAFAAAVLVYVIAAWAVVVGVLIVIWALRLREEISDEWTMLLLGAVSIVFGVLAFANVRDGILALRSIFAVFMIVGGVLAIVLSFRLRGLGGHVATVR